MAIHDVFSKRGKAPPEVFVHDKMPQKMRQQMVYIYRDSIAKLRFGTYSPFAKILDAVAMEHGLDISGLSGMDGLAQLSHLLLASDDVNLALDIAEFALKEITHCQAFHGNAEFSYTGMSLEETAAELNHRFLEHGIGYQFDVPSQTIVRIDNTHAHAAIIKPVLGLLSQSQYVAANAEFIAALEHYKKGRYGDAITNAGAAYESVMKVICTVKGWAYAANATAIVLVETIANKGGLDGKFKSALIGAANIRNAVSTAHGGGTTPRTAEEHHCQLTLNLAASAILYLVDEFG